MCTLLFSTMRSYGYLHQPANAVGRCCLVLWLAFLTSCSFDSSGVTKGPQTCEPTEAGKTAGSTEEPWTMGGTSSTSGPAPTTGDSCTLNVYGPVHDFAGLSGTLYVTQGCCSPSCAVQDCECGQEDIDNLADNATFFCEHFYGAGCGPLDGYYLASDVQLDAAKLHNGAMCSDTGRNIPGTDCFGSPCRIGFFAVPVMGLTNLVCACQTCSP